MHIFRASWGLGHQVSKVPFNIDIASITALQLTQVKIVLQDDIPDCTP
jgi:hypothetical protein